jgi:uncharacterized membrane protein
MEPELYASLDARLSRLERETADLRGALSAARPAAPAVSVATATPPGYFYASSIGGEAPHRPSGDVLERFVAGRGLQLAGLFLVLLGAAFFLDLAFTRNWIGPAERILMGLIGGAALIAAGASRRKPSDVPIAESLVALGAGISYLSLWAAVAVFPDLGVSRGTAFVAMIVVTGVLAVLSATRRSQRIALFGLAGGFLTPVLLSSGEPHPTTLAAYVFVLTGAFLTLAIRERYRVVEAAAFGLTTVFLPAFMPQTASWNTATACFTITILCALTAVALTAGAVRDNVASAARIVMLAIDALVYVALLFGMFAGTQTTLGIAYVLLASVLLAAAIAGARRLPMPRALVLTYGYLAAAAATCALPALLHRTSLLDALFVEGALLTLIGARRGDRSIGAAAGAILATAATGLCVEAATLPPANTAFSSLTLAFVIAIAAFAYVSRELARLRVETGGTTSWAAAAGVACSVVVAVALARVLLDALGGPAWNSAVPSHAQVAISLAWTLYAALLFAGGVRRGSRMLLGQGLTLFALTICKAFLVDLSNVDTAWRIASFVVLGLACIAASAWYMRSQLAKGAAA